MDSTNPLQAPGDKLLARSDNSRMTTPPTREEFEARIAAAEARADARFIAFEKSVGDAMGEIRTELVTVKTRLEALQGIKATTIGTGIAVGAALIGALALGGAMFDSGRDTANLAAEAQRGVDAAIAETAKQQAEMRQLLDTAIQNMDNASPK